MSSKHGLEIDELPADQRALASQKYRKPLFYAARSAIWVGYLYFLIRTLALLFSHQQTWQMWTMLLLELTFAHLARKEHMLSVAASKVTGGGPRKRLRLRGTKNLPRVDVLVPCCGEPVNVIMETVRAACTMDYPINKFRVMLLDDGGSAVLKRTISDLKPQWPHLSYHSRGRQSGQVFAKSGNLNYALTTLQNEDPPEFCAVLDADSIPKGEFLRATLPHLLLNPDSALVSTRQFFSNLPEGDQLSQARCHFYTCQNAELDILGRAIDAGSGAVFRRKSIVQVGMYPTFSFSEDWQLSLVLQGLGHRTMQVQEPLQFGLVPTSLTGHIAQRSRWNIGHAQQVVAMFSPNAPHLPKSLRMKIAWNGIGIVGGELGCLLAFTLIPMLMISGNMIPDASLFWVKLQLILAGIHILLVWLYEYIQAAHTGFESAPFAHLENKWQAAGNIYSILKFYFLTSKPKGSFVTGSTANSWNRTINLPSYMKLLKELLQNGIICNVMTLIMTFGAIFYTTAIALLPENEGEATGISTSIGWPPLLHLCYLSISSNWVPVSYLLSPPNYPDRKSQPSQGEPQKKGLRQNKWSILDKAGRDVAHFGSRLDIVEEAEL